MSAMLLSAQERAPEGYTLGQPWTGQTGVRETSAEIMAREKIKANPPRSPHIKPFRRMPSAANGLGHEINRNQNLSPLAALSPAGAGGPLTPQTLGVNFTGA